MISEPCRTRALVVGVERYEAGPRWELDGPVPDACRFARWLVSRGVPAAQIILLASPLPDNQKVLDGCGLPYRPADRATVQEALTRELRAASSDLLLLYWGGHGVIDGRGTRRLFYADATVEDKRNLNLTSLLESLTSSFFPSHPDQLVIVDACQNLVEELRLVNSLPGETFPVGLPVTGRSQHVLLAASPGQLATNSTARQTGVFSEAVLDELTELTAAPDAAWPPDPAGLARRLDHRFETLRASGRVEQTPAYLWTRGPHEEGLVMSGPVTPGTPVAPTPDRRLPVEALGELTDLLLQIDDITHDPSRREIILFMPVQLRSAVPDGRNPRMHVINWIRACEQHRGGRTAFVNALRLGLAGHARLPEILAAIDRLWPDG